MYLYFITVTVILMALGFYGTFFKALPCFCLIMHSLRNNPKLEYAWIPENINHNLYIKLHTAYLTNVNSF